MITPRGRTFFWLLALIALMVFLLVLFPAAYRFAEGAARSLVRLWWLVLLLALGIWLIWGVGRRPKP
ncbi:MAG: hypothetical protein ACXW3Z_08190 [Limisphaerales bacterium]